MFGDPVGRGKRGVRDIDLGEGEFTLMATVLLLAAGFLGSKANRWAESERRSNKRFGQRRANALFMMFPHSDE